MNRRMFGLSPGGKLSLDRAANRRRNVWQVQKKARAREQRERKDVAAPARKGGGDETA